MRSLTALKAAGLVLAAVVLGLLTVQGSLALWNKAVPSTAGTVQAANFSVLVNGVEMSSLTGTQALNLGELKPGASTYTQVQITNNVDAGSNMRIQPVIATGTPTGGFAGYLTVKTALPAAGQGCAGLTYSGLPDLGAVARSATKTVCVQVSLDRNTPSSVLGTTASIPATLTVNQLPA